MYFTIIIYHMYLHNFSIVKVQTSFTNFYSKYSLSCAVLLKKPERAKRTIKGFSITREKFAPSSVHASYYFFFFVLFCSFFFSFFLTEQSSSICIYLCFCSQVCLSYDQSGLLTTIV